MSEINWHGKPYYSLDAYLKNTYNYKCYKVALNAHMTCPNRDGTLDNRGCIFCSAGGSGDFAIEIGKATGTDATDKFPQGTACWDLAGQLEEGIRLVEGKLGAQASETTQTTPNIIAYFQAYTNTYAPVEYLRKIFTEALSCPKVCGISIATRPDCLPDEVLDLLAELKALFPEKFIWIELGLQTIHEDTARYIRRGYALPCFEEAMTKLQALGIPVIVHMILGLPGETNEMMLETVRYLNTWKPFGIKLQLLHILEHTDLATSFVNGEFDALTKEAYLDILIKCLENLSPDIVVHRVTGDGPKKILIAPKWSGNKRDVLNSLHSQMRKLDTKQGAKYD